MDLLDFHGTHKMVYTLHLKHSSFWPSADVKSMQNDQVYVMPNACCLSLSLSLSVCVCVYYDLYGSVIVSLS